MSPTCLKVQSIKLCHTFHLQKSQINGYYLSYIQVRYRWVIGSLCWIRRPSKIRNLIQKKYVQFILPAFSIMLSLAEIIN